MKNISSSQSGLLKLRVGFVLCLGSVAICLPLLAGPTKTLPRATNARKQLHNPANILTSSASGTATFSPIGFLPGNNSSEIRAVNADGSVAVGGSGSGQAGTETGQTAVQWTASGGLVPLPGIPADGTTGRGSHFIVGSDITATGSWLAYRTRPGGTGTREAMICSSDFSQVLPLGHLAPNQQSAANQISDDGSIVFGFANGADFFSHSFRWTQATGMQQIIEPPASAGVDRFSFPAGRACSAAGNVSIGLIQDFDDNTGDELNTEAYLWTASGGMQLLGYLPGGDRSAALAISADGSTIFGVSRSTNASGTGQTNPWDYSGELFIWTASTGMTPLGVPAGYNIFSNFAGMSADGALLAVAVSDSTHVKPDGFVIIRTATNESFFSNDLLAAAGAGGSTSGWSGLGPLGISDNGDTLFGIGIDPNGLWEGWVANFPVGYLRSVQTFSASNPNTSVNISSGGVIGHDGSYSANSVIIGSPSGSANRRPSNGAAPSSGASLTLSGSATLSVNGSLTVNSGSSFNLLGAATMTSGGLDLAAGATLGVELDAAAESINRLNISGPVDLTGQPNLDLVLSYGPAGGTAYTIIHNTSLQPIQGQFAGFPENGTVLVGGARAVRATYSGGTTGHDFVLTVLPPPPVTSLVSRMTNSAGTFDLPLTGSPGIECRSSNLLGVGNYTIVFTFVNNLTSVGSARVSSGTGSVSSSTMGPNANQYTVNLTGVQNAQRISVTLTSAIDSQNNAGDISLPMAILIGDTNSDGVVNSADIGQTKSQSGKPVTGANFREDLNGDGSINSADIGLVKSESGTGLP